MEKTVKNPKGKKREGITKISLSPVTEVGKREESNAFKMGGGGG